MEKLGRRAFVSSGLVGCLAVATARNAQAAPNADSSGLIDGLPVLNYGRSFICGKAEFNNVRLWVESRTILKFEDRSYECLQFGSCKSEDTFAEKNLFYADNYDFLPILGEDEKWLVFRRKSRATPDYRRIQDRIWGEADRKLRFSKQVDLLTSFDAIREATLSGIPLVSRTELHNSETGISAVIEAPVKTINIRQKDSLYQIDTGPVALPRLDRVYEPVIDCLQLAFVAFNAPQFADFVIEQPLSINGEDGSCEILHYANPVSLPAKNSLIAVRD